MNKNGSFLLIACVWLAIFLVVLGVAYELLRRENRELRAVVVAQQDINHELRAVVVAQQNINHELIEVNDGLVKLNDELLGTVDKLTEKLN